jgi:hypothetical protein
MRNVSAAELKSAADNQSEPATQVGFAPKADKYADV